MHGLCEIPFRLSFVHTAAIQVRVDLFGGNKVRHRAKMQGKLGYVAAVIGEQASALLVDGRMFNKLAVGLPESNHPVTGLLHQCAVITFFEAHNFIRSV
ncbi:MAG: hypothetical protein ACK5SK_04435 [Cyclobacteriaceae bacterium]